MLDSYWVTLSLGSISWGSENDSVGFEIYSLVPMLIGNKIRELLCLDWYMSILYIVLLISFIRHLCMWYSSNVHAVPSARHWHMLFELQPDGGLVVLYANRHGERSHHSQFPKRTCKFRYTDADPTWIAATCRLLTFTKQADSSLKKEKWCSRNIQNWFHN